MTQEEMEKQDRELQQMREQRHALRTLIESPEWKTLEDIGNGQIQHRINSIVLTPLAGADAVFEQEYKKGEVQGIKLFFSLPMTLIESLSEDIDKMTKGADDE